MKSFVNALDRRFRLLHERSVEFVEKIPGEKLYLSPVVLHDDLIKLTAGENILRSAANVEMTFGGITSRLWDDPFEWTLPEALSDPAKVIGYLREVEETRLNGFGFFNSDDDFRREIPAPRDLMPIGELLLQTLARAEHYQGRAFAIFEALGCGRLPIR